MNSHPPLRECWKRDSVVFRDELPETLKQYLSLFSCTLLGQEKRKGKDGETDRDMETEILSLQNSEKFLREKILSLRKFVIVIEQI